MKLVANWRRVVRKAWSVRLMLLAAFLSAVEVGLGLTDARTLGLPEGAFAATSCLVTALAFVARFLAQPDMEDADEVQDE